MNSVDYVNTVIDQITFSFFFFNFELTQWRVLLFIFIYRLFTKYSHNQYGIFNLRPNHLNSSKKLQSLCRLEGKYYSNSTSDFSR